MVSYQGGRDKWVVLGDLIFMNLGATRTSTSGPVTVRKSRPTSSSRCSKRTWVTGLSQHDVVRGRALHRHRRRDRRLPPRVGPWSTSRREPAIHWIDPVVGLLGEWPLDRTLGSGTCERTSAASAWVRTSPGRPGDVALEDSYESRRASPATGTWKWTTTRMAPADCSTYDMVNVRPGHRRDFPLLKCPPRSNTASKSCGCRR